MGNLSTPKSVQKLQMELHAKTKAEAGYRFYALYDKINHEDNFESIPHAELLQSVARRIVDRRVLLRRKQ